MSDWVGLLVKIGPTQMAVTPRPSQVGQLAPQPREVAAVVVALLVRQVAVREHVLLGVAGHARAGEVAAVVAVVAVVEPVGNGEVEHLVDERVAHGLAHQGGVVDRLDRGHGDLEHVADLVVAEGDHVTSAAHRERDVGAVTGTPPAP